MSCESMKGEISLGVARRASRCAVWFDAGTSATPSPEPSNFPPSAAGVVGGDDADRFFSTKARALCMFLPRI